MNYDFVPGNTGTKPVLTLISIFIYGYIEIIVKTGLARAGNHGQKRLHYIPSCSG